MNGKRSNEFPGGLSQGFFFEKPQGEPHDNGTMSFLPVEARVKIAFY